MFRYYKRLRNILEILMSSEVNKVFKDNPIFLYFVPTPRLIIFQNPLTPPPPPFVMNLRVRKKNRNKCRVQNIVYYIPVCEGPCKRTQHVGTTLPNIVGFRVFKRPQHVGQCCFNGNTDGRLGLIFTQTFCETTMLSRPSTMMALDEHRRWKTRKCIAITIALCHLENTPRHITGT